MKKEEKDVIQALAYAKNFLKLESKCDSEKRAINNQKMKECFPTELMSELVDCTERMMKLREQIHQSDEFLMVQLLDVATKLVERKSFCEYDEKELDMMIDSFIKISNAHREMQEVIYKEYREISPVFLSSVLSAINKTMKKKGEE